VRWAGVLVLGVVVVVAFLEVVLSCWKLEGQWDLIGLLLSALNLFKMILFWGLKKIPLLLEIPTLKDHLSFSGFCHREEELLFHVRFEVEP
jgi:hypothetical protein